MMKKIFPVLIVALLFLNGCASRQPPPPPKDKVKTEFLLVGHRSPTGQPDRSQEGLEKKKEIYHTLKNLSGQSHIVIIRKDYVRAMEACADVELVYSSPKEGFDPKDLLKAIQFLGSEKAYIGDTPIGYSVLKAHSLLKGLPNSTAILITDGEETGPLLAQNISKDKAWEQRLKRDYSNFDELTVSAFDSIKKLVDEKIHFSPILYGLRGSGDKEAQKIRDFYHKLATASGSASLEAATPHELLNAFMEAEMMSFTYGLYSTESDKKGQLMAKGKVGIPLMIEEGKYLLRTDTEKPFEQEVELKPRVKNVYSFNINKDGKMSLMAIGHT